MMSLKKYERGFVNDMSYLNQDKEADRIRKMRRRRTMLLKLKKGLSGSIKWVKDVRKRLVIH